VRIATWNVNGLRAALKKGFPEALSALRLDALMLQEVRSLPSQLPDEWVSPQGWNVWWNPAEKKGYSGTATWSRAPLDILGLGLSGEDSEGRVVHVQTGGVQLINVYLPSGSSGADKQLKKEAFMARLLPWSRAFAQSDVPTLLGGDLNIAHTDNDIHNPAGNKKNSGFLPHERAWFSEFLDVGWVDVVRGQAGNQKGPYSWWSNRGQARALDRGWRIDYLLANKAAADRVRAVETHRDYGITVSDHAPVVVELDL
jgi:exodeoxyribonuclease-3